MTPIPPETNQKENQDTFISVSDLKSIAGDFHTLKYYTKKELKYHVPPEKFEQTWLLLKLTRQVSSISPGFDKLPLHYVLTPELSKELHLCDQELSRIIHTDKGFLNRESEYLAETFSTEAIHSSKLEGAVTTEVVAQEMLRKNLLPKNKDQQMILNNHAAMQFIRDKSDLLLTPEFICEVQKIITCDTLKDETASGAFRTTDDIRVVDKFSGKIIHEPPKASEIPELIESLCEYINSDKIENKSNENEIVFVHPLIKAMTLHFLIGYIHPFVDGNGRTARALFYWYVLSRGYKLFEYIPISKIIRQSPAKYRDAYLATEDDDLDMTYFFLYHVNCIKKAREALNAHIDAEEKRTRTLYEVVSHLPQLTKRQKQILIYILEHRRESFTIDEISARFCIVYQTARTDLMHLTDLHYLSMQKQGRAFSYSVNHEFDVEGDMANY